MNKSLRSLTFPSDVDTSKDDIDQVLMNPCLAHSVSYDRGVGYFTSSWLQRVATGIGGFAQNGGTMRLLTSPKLKPEDWAAIKQGADAIEDDVLERIPGQGQMPDREGRGDQRRQQGDQGGGPLRQGGGRNRDRGQQQQRERVLQAAGQRQEPAELAQIKGDLPGGKGRAGAIGGAEMQHQPEVHARRQGDQRQAFEQGERKAQAKADEQHADGLSAHGQPAQQDQGLQAQRAPGGGEGQAVGLDQRHLGACAGLNRGAL